METYRKRRALGLRETLEFAVRQTFKKSEILRGKDKFETVFQRGRKIDGKCLRCLCYSHPPSTVSDQPIISVGIAISRKLKRAVDRNRMKRLVRESFRLNKQLLHVGEQEMPTQVSLLFLYNPKLKITDRLPSYEQIHTDMQYILASVSRLLPGSGKS